MTDGRELAAVRWPSLLQELERRHAQARDAASRRVLAEASSLAARFEADYAAGARRVARAVELEPLEPLHQVRAALHELRFGRAREAAALADALDQRLPGHPLAVLVRGLTLLASGEPRRAVNVAAAHAAAAPAAGGASAAALRFLEFGAGAREQAKGADARLERLPKGERFAALQAEALLTLLAAHPREAATARKRVDQGLVARGSRAASLVRDALTWAELPAGRETEALADAPAGTRREEAALLFLTAGEAWRGLDGEALVRRLRALDRALPGRAAVRRLYAHALTRLAVERFGRDDRHGALQLVQLCLELEPHEPAHHQNRAAVFTALADHEGYHDAWASLDRHHYRLCLLGVGDVACARLALRPHRMFAQQARLTPRDPARPSPEQGVFREELVRDEGGAARPVLRVNQSRIEADPEQLRQWVHHRRAELFFAHAALGGPLARTLLWPDDAASGRARVDALASAGASLAALAGPEGEALARAWGGAWRAGVGELPHRYGPPPADDVAAAQLEAAHAESLGDLCLLACQWRPLAERPDLAADLVAFALAEAPFFHERALYAALDDPKRPAPIPARVLHHVVMLRRGGDDDRPALGPAERDGVARWIASQLLVGLALAQAGGAGGRGASAGALERALATLVRARSVDPACARAEFHTAQLCAVLQRDDEARAALGRFLRLARDEDADLTRAAEEVKQVLDRRRRGPSPTSPAPAAPDEAPAAGGERARSLEAEVERFPSAIAPYEALARHLQGDGRADEAVACAERAIARCLSRDGQLRARALHLEALGLRHLGPSAEGAVRLYLAGSRDALRAVLEATPLVGRPYPLEYVLGRCLLAARRRGDALAAFGRAVEGCDRAIHLSVLRPLASDVDAAMVGEAEAALTEAAEGGRLGDAFATLEALWASCERREGCVVELARLHHLAAAASLAGAAAVARGSFAADAPWGAALAAALGERDEVARVEALCALAAEVHPPSRPRAEAIARKAKALRRQAGIARAVREAAAHVQGGRLAEALAALEATRDDGAAEPRWLRMSAVVLLRLERFEEADRAVAELRGARDPEAVELVQRYPELAFRGRVAAATRRLRAGDLDGAGAALAGAAAVGREQRLELAFCVAFRLALVARRREAGGERDGARRALLEAVDALEPLVPEAREAGHRRLLDLYAQVERDLAAKEAGR